MSFRHAADTEQVPAHLIQQLWWGVVQVLHEVLQEEEQSREQHHLAVLHGSLGSDAATDLRTADYPSGCEQQDRLLLHEIEGVEQEEQHLGMLNVQVLVVRVTGSVPSAYPLHQGVDEAVPHGQAGRFLLLRGLQQQNLDEH